MASSPYDRALALCPGDAAKLELARIGAELGLGADAQEWIVVVLYAEARRLFGSSDRAGEDEGVRRLEAAAARVEAAIARASSRAVESAKLRRRWPFGGLLAIAALVGLTAWFGGATVAIANARFSNARVATLLTTRAGAAALGILDANGADLPGNLTRCRRFTIHGRSAQDCVLWNQGPARAAQRDPLSNLLLALQGLPAWPFATLAFVALLIASGLAAMKTGPRVREI